MQWHCLEHQSRRHSVSLCSVRWHFETVLLCCYRMLLSCCCPFFPPTISSGSGFSRWWRARCVSARPATATAAAERHVARAAPAAATTVAAACDVVMVSVVVLGGCLKVLSACTEPAFWRETQKLMRARILRLSGTKDINRALLCTQLHATSHSQRQLVDSKA